MMKYFLKVSVGFVLFVSFFSSVALAEGLTKVMPREEGVPYSVFSEVIVKSILVSKTTGTGTINIDGECEECPSILVKVTSSTVFYALNGALMPLEKTGTLTGKWIDLEYDGESKNAIAIRELPNDDLEL